MSTLSRRFRLLAAASTLALASQVVGCVTDAQSQSDDITDVANSKVKRQSIGNCWIYASIGWAESLRLGYSGEELNLSESYVTYWHWLEEISGGAAGMTAVASLDGDEVSTGGFWGVAAELMRRYGVMDEGKFIPEEAEAARSARQASALSAINASLKTGVLSDRTKRKDLAVVRAELDKAWQLSPEVIALLDDTFGQKVTKNLEKGAVVPEGSGLHTPKSIEIAMTSSGPLTLADAIGKPSSSYNVRQRSGTYAWNEESYPYYPSGRRDFLAKAQKAMHGGLPVIMTWFVDFNAMKSNTFKEPPATPGRQGGHMTVLEDYQVTNVPGYGTLEAGTVVTDQKALDAALSKEATIEFFRIKNSWGSDLAPPGASDDFKGYNDLYMKYLNGPITKCTAKGDDPCASKTQENGLWAFVLPPSKFPVVAAQKAPAPEPDPAPAVCGEVCTEGDAKDPASDCQCVVDVCEYDSFCCGDSGGNWDAQCVKTAVELCGVTCQ
ncbi:MAG: hypothetical protein R3B70_00495 [Polyangiaceae bacterium]